MCLAADIDAPWVSRFGTTLFLNIAFLMGSVFYYGVYIILVCFAIPILCSSNKPGNANARLVMLAAILLMFAISTITVIIRAMFVLLGLKTVFMDGCGSGDGIDTFKTRMGRLLYVELTLCYLEILIGDSLVIWRAYVLWSKKLNILIIPILLHIGTVTLAFALWVCEGQHSESLADLSPHVASPCIPFRASALDLSIATNIAATVVIGYKVWLHRKAAIKYFARSNQAGKIVRLVLLFAGLYCFIWISGIVVATPFGAANASLPLQSINFWLQGSIRHVVGIYPTLLIVVAHLQKSFWAAPDQPALQNSFDQRSLSERMDEERQL